MNFYNVTDEESKILPNEEIISLIKKYRRTKKIGYRNKIVMSNLKAVYKMAHKYASSSNTSRGSFDDLVSEGVIGIIEAIERFDLERGASFSTYSHYWILKKISENMHLGTLNLPINKILLYNNYLKLVDKENNISIEEASSRLGVKRKALEDLLQKKETIYLENYPFDSREALSKSKAEDIESEILRSIEFEKMIEFMDERLNEREKKVIVARYGIENGEEKTLQEISRDIGVSHEYVRVIQKKALKKLESFCKKTCVAKHAKRS